MTTTRNSKASETARATQLIAGVQKHFASMVSLMLASTAYTPAQVAAALQALVDLYAAVDAAKSAVRAKLVTQEAQAPALLKLMSSLVALVKVTFSESPEILADFGLAPRKVPAPLTAEQQVVAVAKREATRAARGTTSKKAKQAVKGNVVGVTITPVTGAPPVASPAVPSTPGGTGGAVGGTPPKGA